MRTGGDEEGAGSGDDYSPATDSGSSDGAVTPHVDASQTNTSAVVTEKHHNRHLKVSGGKGESISLVGISLDIDSFVVCSSYHVLYLYLSVNCLFS